MIKAGSRLAGIRPIQTVLMEKFIHKGHVEKIRDQDDYRIYNIRLTGKGKVLMPRYLEVSRELREASYKGFTGKGREQLYNMLVKLEGNL